MSVQDNIFQGKAIIDDVLQNTVKILNRLDWGLKHNYCQAIDIQKHFIKQ